MKFVKRIIIRVCLKEKVLYMLELVASNKVTIRKENEMILVELKSLQIQDVNKLMDGGVYMFAIDNIPLYVGETYNFYLRFSEHLVNLVGDANYFGLSKLIGEHCMGFYIINDKLPYNGIKLSVNKRATDKNKKARTDLEKTAINCYCPMTQRLPQGCSIQYKSNKKYDGMIKNGVEKSEVVEKIQAKPVEYGYCYDGTIYKTNDLME